MNSGPWDAAATRTLRQADALLATPALRWLEGASWPWVTDPWTSLEVMLRASLVAEHSTAPTAPAQQRDAAHAWAWAAARPASAVAPAGRGAHHGRPAAEPVDAPLLSWPGAMPARTPSVQDGRARTPRSDVLSGHARRGTLPTAQDAGVDVAGPSPWSAPSSAFSTPTRAQRLANASLLRGPTPAAQVSRPGPDLAPAVPASARVLAWPGPGFAGRASAGAAVSGDRDGVTASAPAVRGQAGAAAGARTRLVSGLPALQGLLQQALVDRPARSGHAAPARVQPLSLAVEPAVAPATADRPAEVQHLPPATAAAAAAAPVAAPSPAVAAPVAPETRPLLQALDEDVLVDRLMDRLEERLREQALRQFGRSGGLV